MSAFYTREYYQLCLDHINPGGLVSQWVPLHSLDPDVVRSLMYTFTTVFPDYCAFFINADLFVIGSDRPLRIDYDRATARLEQPEIARVLHAADFPDTMEFVASFFMGKKNIDAFVTGGTLMTDDHPWAEFEAPKLVYQQTVDKSLQELTPHFEAPIGMLAPGVGGDAVLEKLDRRHRAKVEVLEGLKVYYGPGIGTEPDVHFEKALAIDPMDGNARYFLTEITLARVKRFVKWKEFDKALACAQKALASLPGELPVLLALGDAQAQMGAQDDARKTYQEYVRLGGQAVHAKEAAGKSTNVGQ